MPTHTIPPHAHISSRKYTQIHIFSPTHAYTLPTHKLRNTHMHTHKHAHEHTHLRANTCADTCTHAYTHINTYTHIHRHVQLYKHTRMYTHIWTHSCTMHTHTCMHTQTLEDTDGSTVIWRSLNLSNIPFLCTLAQSQLLSEMSKEQKCFLLNLSNDSLLLNMRYCF